MKLACLILLTATAGLAQTPSITNIYNNYSRISQASSSGGVAQGAIFIVQGAGLSDRSTGLQDATGGLQTTLEGVRIRVTVGTTTAYAPLYYVLPDQLAGVLPSTLPTGIGNVRVENNGRVSGASQIRVVKRRLGVLAYDAPPNLGRAIAQDKNYALLGPNNSTHPGEVIIFYGSGLGPVKAGVDETTLQTGVNASGNMTEIAFTANIGGKDAQVEYRGRSIYPGLDQLNIRVPALDTSVYGCDVPVVIMTDNVAAGSTTIPVTQSGSACAPYQSGGVTNPNTQPSVIEVGDWITAGWFRWGTISLGKSVSRYWTYAGYPGPQIPTIIRSSNTSVNVSLAGTSSNGQDEYDEWLTERYADKGPGLPAGTCEVYTPVNSGPRASSPSRGLDAGPAFVITGPSGALVFRRTTSNGINFSYDGFPVPTTFIDAAGRYVFKAAGGPDVDTFSGFLDVPADFVVTNAADLELLVPRDKDATIRWTGGGDGFVTIAGNSRDVLYSGPSFRCRESASAGKFTIPAGILSQLPPTVMDGEKMLSFSSLSVQTGVSNRLTPPHNLELLTASFSWSWSFTPEYR